MPEPLPELPARFRPRRGRVVAYAIALVVLVVMTALAVALPAEGRTGFRLVDRLLLVGLGGLVATGLGVLARPRVDLDQRGLTVVNLFRQRRLEWAEIVAVRLAPGDPWVMLDLSDGETLPVMGISASDGARSRRQAAALAAFVVEHSRTERDD